MNIKEAYTEHIAVQTSRIDSPHETTWKALNKHGFKKSIIVFNGLFPYMYMVLLWEGPMLDSGPNDAKSRRFKSCLEWIVRGLN